MNKEALKNLLKEYEQKKLEAELAYENKMNAFYLKNPDLLTINHQINQLSIALSKAILEGKNTKTINSDLEVAKKEKEKLLKNLNLPADFFAPHYACSKCQDTGYLISNNQVMCTCLKQKLLDYQYNQSNISSLETQNFDCFSLEVFSDKADKSKYGSDLSPRQNTQKIKEIAENFIAHFDDLEEKNLLFTGNTGLGKTYLTNCIAAELLKQGKTVLYQTAPVMLDAIIDFKFGKNTDFTYQDLLNVDLLIIDDLGTENSNNLKLSELFNILNTRLLNQNHHITKTIISTNLSLNNLFKTYDERIFSRLVGYYTVCKFFGEDLRYANRKIDKK